MSSTDNLESAMIDFLEPLTNRANRELIKYAVQRAIFCPVSNVVLDMRRAVLLTVTRADGTHVQTMVMDNKPWDARGAAVRAGIADKGYHLEILDGREWFATDAQRAALQVIEANGSALMSAKTDVDAGTVSRAAVRALVANGVLAEYPGEGKAVHVRRAVAAQPVSEPAPGDAS